jgi:hypothetical protein
MAEAVVKLDVPGKIPITFQLDDRAIDGATLKPLSFQGFVDCVKEAQVMSQPKTFEARLKRQRLLRQIVFYTGNAITKVSSSELLRMPLPVARLLLSKLEEADESPPGKIIRHGDGVASAITFELGTSIPVGSGKPPIKELEFLAATYGDLEDVMAATNRIEQSLMLISNVAKPLGTSLSQLPSWAVAQISTADGFAIGNEVVPLFLESPVES